MNGFVPLKALVAFSLFSLYLAPTYGATITVDSTADNTTSGNGACTLREAIANANGDSDTTSGDCVAGSGADIIDFDETGVPDNSTITLSVGELLLTSDISILPFPPVEGLTIDANASVGSQRRVFRQNAAASDVVIDHLTITGGVTDEQGGGYYLQSGNTLVLTNSRITDNETLSTGSNGDGGGIRIASGTVTMNVVTIDGNVSADDGGAINISGGSTSATLTNVTMCNNEAGDDGGAIEATGNSTLSLIYSTVYNNANGALNQGGNASSTGGGIYSQSSATVNLDATILAGNWDCNNECGTFPGSPDGDDTRNDCLTASSGSISSNGYNLFQSYGASNCTAVASDVVCTGECSGSNAHDGIGPIADNGGPVVTHAIDCDTSPAADQIPTSEALCSGGDDFDARGVARPGSGGGTGCDIGAFECTTALVPVTLAYFSSRQEGSSTLIEWSTATEVGTVGFNLYEKTPVGRRLLNSEALVAASFESTQRRDYSFHTIHAQKGPLFLEEVDLTGRNEIKGPFEIGRTYGRRTKPSNIDWASVRAGLESHRLERDSLEKTSLEEKASDEGGLSQQVAVLGPPSLDRRSVTPGAQFLVSEKGLYRVRRDALLPFGIDLANLDKDGLIMSAGGEAVYFHLETGVNGFVEFWGEPLDTLYTDTNVYRLEVARNPRLAHSAPLPPNSGEAPRTWAEEQFFVEENLEYSFLSPADDPWAFRRFIARGGSVEEDFDFEIDHLSTQGADAFVRVEAWGLSTWPDIDPDHHIVIEVNGSAVAEARFDGLARQFLQAQIPTSQLQNGSNTLTFRVPGDTGGIWDIVLLERFSVEYPRELRAREGQLDAQLPGQPFEVLGLADSETVVWHLDRRPVRWHGEAEADGDGFRLVVPARARGRYAVVSESAIRTPTLESLAVPSPPALDGTEMVMITHASLRSALQPLVDHHVQNGLVVSVVDAASLYHHYGHGIFDPDAIRRYLRTAATDKLRFILLVGGDSYDYRNFLDLGSVSLIPSLYAPTDDLVRWAPVDPLYADLDDDNLPDLPIGRLPARTAEELDAMILKLLSYSDGDWGGRALFVADDSEQVPFRAISESFADLLPAPWSVDRVHLDDLAVNSARQEILDRLEEGVALTSFVGHSGPNSWTFDGLFTAADAAALNNAGRPTVVTQWGCWNTYYVDPEVNTLAHAFLLHSGGGAAAVLGATTITESSSEEALGAALMEKLADQGLTIGEAIQAAKEELATRAPGRLDVLLGWTLLGDPALTVASP